MFQTQATKHGRGRRRLKAALVRPGPLRENRLRGEAWPDKFRAKSSTSDPSFWGYTDNLHLKGLLCFGIVLLILQTV